MSDHVPSISRDNFRDRWLERCKGRSGPLSDRLLRRMVMASPILCAHLLLDGPNRPPFNGRFLYGDVHLKWDRILTGQRRFAVMAPRGIGKSEVFSFAFPIWNCIRAQVAQGLIICSTFENSNRVLQKVRDEIETNPLLRWLYPANRAARQWNTKQLTMSNGHQLLARSALSRIRGLHPDYVIGDDVLTDDAKFSETYRKRVSDFWFSVVEQLPVTSGQLGIVGTPMHQSDILYHDLNVNKAYSHHRFPILDDDGRSLWPEMYPVDYVVRQKDVIGATRFATELMVRPVSDESSMLPRSLLAGCPQEQYSSRLAMAPDILAPLGLSFFMGVDLAFSASAKADYFCLLVLGIDSSENHWIIDIVREQGVPYHRQFSLVNEFGRRYGCQRIYVEANQAQSILGNELIRNTSLPVKKYTMTARKHSLDAGFPSLRRLAENQKWRIPRGDANSINKTEILMDELASFTFVGGKVISVGSHDDTTSALYLATEAARAGRGFHFGQGKTVSVRKVLPGVAGSSELPTERPRGNF